MDKDSLYDICFMTKAKTKKEAEKEREKILENHPYLKDFDWDVHQSVFDGLYVVFFVRTHYEQKESEDQGKPKKAENKKYFGHCHDVY